MIEWIEWLLLFCQLALGICCAWSDFKYHIVSNKIIFLGFSLGLVFQVVFTVLFTSEYIVNILLNYVIACFLGLVFYCGSVWAAGDVKLYIVLSLYVPQSFFGDSIFLPPAVILMFIFSFAMIWLLGDTIWSFLHGAEKFSKEKLFSKRRVIIILKTYIQITTISAIISWLFPDFYNNNTLLVSVLLITYSYFCANNHFLNKWYIVLLHGFVLVVLSVSGCWHFSFSPWWVYTAIFATIVFYYWAAKYNYRRIKTTDARQGMILAASTIFCFSSSKVLNLPTDASESMTARLTSDQVQAIIRWEKTAKGESEIVAVRKIPFAIFISLGTLLWTYICISGGVLNG